MMYGRGMYSGGMYGGGMYGGGMYGGGMYGGMQHNQQPPNEAQQEQFDFRREMQNTIGGLNATLGLCFGAA